MKKIQIINDPDKALLVMKETALWCRHAKIALPPSWDNKHLNARHLAERWGAEDSDYFVFLLDGKPAGACILFRTDSLREWKKYGYKQKCYYLNKLCVLEKYRGTGASHLMLDALKKKCIADGYDSIRLVAEEKIAPIYINSGWFPHWSFKGGRTGKTYVRCAWYRWTPDQFETIWRGSGRFNLRRVVYRFLKRVLWFV